MSRAEYIRASVAIATSQLFPSRVRDAVISDPKFIQSFGLKADAVIRFGRDDLTFQRSVLFDATRQALRPGHEAVSVDNMQGETWEVCVIPNKSPVEISLARGASRVLVNHFGLLSRGKAVRLGTLLNEANNLGLLAEQIVVWKELLERRAPTDDEAVIIWEDLKDTPVAVASVIRENLASGSVSLDVWVPRSHRYYERLVGRCEGGLSLDNYAAQVAPQQFVRLLGWRGAEGLKRALLLAAQPRLSAALAEAKIDDGTLGEVLAWLAEKGDVMSCAAGIEIAQPRVAGNDRLREPFGRLLKAFVACESGIGVDRFQLFSCLFLAVYGEMAYCRIHAEKPPFWRKLAAIAQASLIERCIVEIASDAAGLASWLQSVRSQIYLLECLVDLRVEPRWLPDLGFPGQLKNEICGRVWGAMTKFTPGDLGPEFVGLACGDAEGSLKKKFNHVLAGLPGPLEGGTAASVELSSEEVTQIKNALSSTKITLESVSELANAAILFRFPADITDCAFQSITNEEATRLQWRLVWLCHLVPELWATCGQAEAALRSILKI